VTRNRQPNDVLLGVSSQTPA